jgi:hypothetical protein
MPRRATVYEVLIASPNDVSEERNLLAEVIANWNSAHSFSRGILLRSLRWELDATPAADGHPQDIINHQIVDRADLVLGVFGLRLGNPTRLAASGTAEEIERLRAAGKPVLLYFSEKMIPIHHDAAQLKAREKYRRSLQKNALYWTYKDLSDLRNAVTNHLASTINKLVEQNVWRITYPEDGASVPRVVEVEGTTDLLLLPHQSVWLVVETYDGPLYPQERVSLNQLDWEAKVTIGTKELSRVEGQMFTIHLVQVGPQSDYDFEKYIRGESHHPDAFGKHWPPDTKRLHKIEVFRRY